MTSQNSWRKISIDLDGDGSFYDPSTQAKTKVSTDTSGAELQQTADGSFTLKMGIQQYKLNHLMVDYKK